MIIGFSSVNTLRDANVSSMADIGPIRTAFQQACIPRHPTSNQIVGGFDYYISAGTPGCTVGGGVITFKNQNTCYSCLSGFSSTMVKSPGDTFTFGCRLTLPSLYIGAANLCLGGFSSNGLALALQYPGAVYSGTGRTPYVELEISCISATSFSLRMWTDGILTYTTNVSSLPSQAVIGVGTLWRGGMLVAAVDVGFSDMYWAFNTEGKSDRVGPCRVGLVPVSLTSGGDNPGASNLLANRLSPSLTDGRWPATTLASPAVSKPLPTMTLPTPTTQIIAVSSCNFGKPTITGQSASVAAKILNSDGSVAASAFSESSAATYRNGLSRTVAFVDSLEKLKSLTFVASGEKT